MSKPEAKENAMTDRAPDEEPRGHRNKPRAATQPAREGTPARGAPERRRSGGASPLAVYKPGQGVYVRWGSAAGAGMIVIGFANFMHEQLAWFSDWVRYLIPAVLLVALGYGVFWAIGRNASVVNFMIATEGEMKKVNWSTRREVLGATKVVIATVIALAVILFTVNVLFIFLFESIGVLRIGMLERLFGGGVQ
jgi:preprotein translocase SecE subunit